MKIRQSRECPLCAEYAKIMGYTLDQDVLDQIRVFSEVRRPSEWHHPSRLGKFIHSQAERHPTIAGDAP